MIIATLLLGASALAADLDLAVSLDEAPPTQVLVRDVLATPVPAFLVSDALGARYLVGATVRALPDGSYQVDLDLTEVEELRRGRLRRLETRTVPFVASPNKTLKVEQGQMIPYVENDEVKFLERSVDVSATVRE